LSNHDRRNIGIDLDRLMGRINDLGQIGALEGGGVCRLALTDVDRQGRDLVVKWMKDLGLAITVDRIGNVMALRPGTEDGPPVVVGSHIDTVATGGLYDGALGVLSGLEAIRVLDDAGIRTKRPIAVAFFTNEEGSRYHPDMMGSAVLHGILDADEVLSSEGIDGAILADDLERIGYAGDAPVGAFEAHCYIELHVEQGPVLDDEGIDIGAVTGVQGIYWTEYQIEGVANHAGTTPMKMRHDAGFVAASIAVEARRIAEEFGGNQVAAAGYSTVSPCLVNVIPGSAIVKTDLRNTGGEVLREANARLAEFARVTARDEGCAITIKPAARFNPVAFDPDMVDRVEQTATRLGHSVKRLPSGAGHDAQMFAPACPTAMIFVPSRDGISHNTEEYTAPEQIRAGADVLLNVLLEMAGSDS
jgi:beta-ureidopropionase / N-carbamoyl-L-amino-acid hydrolase